MNENVLDSKIDEIVNEKNLEKLPTEIETDESIEELTCPQKYESDQAFVSKLDDLNEKEKNDPREFKQTSNILDIITYLFS